MLKSFEMPLARSAGLSTDATKVWLVGDNEVNAFASFGDGGENIFIFSGIVLYTHTANELIGVMAHETGHIKAGHLIRGEVGMQKAMIPMLLYAQDEIGQITGELVDEVATRIGVTPLQVNEVLSYYSMLHTKPLGKYHVQVCTNISCLLHDGDKLYEHACKKLGVSHKEVTADGQFSIEEVECMGACSWAPAIQVNYDFHHFVTPEKLDQILDGLRKKQ